MLKFLEILEQKCRKSQNFLHLTWFLASRRKKGFEKKGSCLSTLNFHLGHVTGNMNFFFGLIALYGISR